MLPMRSPSIACHQERVTSDLVVALSGMNLATIDNSDNAIICCHNLNKNTSNMRSGHEHCKKQSFQNKSNSVTWVLATKLGFLRRGAHKGSDLNHGYYGNHSFDIGMGYSGSLLSSPVIPNSPGGFGNPIRQKELSMWNAYAIRNLGGGRGPRHMDIATVGPSLLEEFKSNKTKCFELSEIANNVVEFSADQYRSRFIQQILEIATVDENMVFDEINLHALSLMTNVFGNYVIQKFFEHGLDHLRRELANKLDNRVLNLSKCMTVALSRRWIIPFLIRFSILRSTFFYS